MSFISQYVRLILVINHILTYFDLIVKIEESSITALNIAPYEIIIVEDLSIVPRSIEIKYPRK